jgi:putative membrane protein
MWDYGYNGAPMMGGYEGYSSAHLLGHIFVVCVSIAVLIVVVRHLRHGKHGMWHHCYGGSAMNLLRERYARGEIETEEYKERKKVLSE